MEKIFQIAMDDGNGEQVPVPGVSKWAPGTITLVLGLEYQTKLGWGDLSGYLNIRIVTNRPEKEFLQEIIDRKWLVNVDKFLSPETKIKFIENVEEIEREFLKKQESMGYAAALAKYKTMFEDTGIKPDFSKVVDLDKTGYLVESDPWQHKPEQIVEAI